METSGLTIANVTLMLAMHPEVQQKVFEEAQSISVDSNGDLNYEDVSKLTYMEMVLKETLRLLPPAPIISRLIKEPTKMTKGIVPSGTNCIIPIYKLHRSTKIWGADANLFVPERFSAEHNGDESHFFYMPFAIGSRNCIAHRYAMLAMKIMLYHLVLKLKFATNLRLEELKFTFVIAMKMVTQYEITAEIR